MTKITAIAVVAALVGAAQASETEAFRINASNSNGSSSFVVTFDQGTWDGNTWSFHLDNATDLGGVGMVESASVVFDGNSRSGQTVTLNFNVAAGALNTVFEVTSAQVGAPYATAFGTASAGVSVTDTLGNGATLSPDGSAVYTAFYNGTPGATFASLIGGSLNAGAFSTATANAEFPGGGSFAPIAGAVNDISARWTFAVSAFDIASGTSVFTVVPAPSSLALLGLGGLALRRRR